MKKDGVKALTDINLSELANEINELLVKHVGGRLWTEIVRFSKVPKAGGVGWQPDAWEITLNVHDQEILGRSDRPSIFGDDPFGTTEVPK